MGFDTVEVRSSSLLVPTILFYCLPGIPVFALAQFPKSSPSLLSSESSLSES
jgi:hypothetical protein